MADYSELKRKAQEIKDEVKAGANTANRVGLALEETVKALEVENQRAEQAEVSLENFVQLLQDETEDLQSIRDDVERLGSDKADKSALEATNKEVSKKQNKLDNYKEDPSNGSVEIFAQDKVSVSNDSQGGVSCVEVYNEEDTEGIIPVARMSADKENGDYASVTVKGNEVHIDGDAVKVNGEDLESFRTTVVNDLTTGGADKALSAEMGKELGGGLTELSMKTKHIHATETDGTIEEIVICNNDETEEIVKINNKGLTAKKIFNSSGEEIESSGMSVIDEDPATLEICDEKQQPILVIDSKGNVRTAFFNSLNVAENKFKGKTMLYIGDSISTGNIWHWKGYIKDCIGLNYVNYNINDTVNVTPAVGGITIRPHNDDDTRPMNAGAAEVGSGAKSIWWRCCNKRLGIYDFDYINLFGGTNDIYDNNLNVGTIDDTPLLDTDVEDLSALDLSQVSFASALMGCIEMLQRDFPGKQIFICTLLYNGYARTPDVVKIQMLAAQKYGLKVVPFYYSELNSQNYQWLCDGFHPKQVAARIMEKNFVQYINL